MIGGWRAETVHKENDVSSKIANFWGEKKTAPQKSPNNKEKNNLFVGLVGKFFFGGSWVLQPWKCINPPMLSPFTRGKCIWNPFPYLSENPWKFGIIFGWIRFFQGPQKGIKSHPVSRDSRQYWVNLFPPPKKKNELKDLHQNSLLHKNPPKKKLPKQSCFYSKIVAPNRVSWLFFLRHPKVLHSLNYS